MSRRLVAAGRILSWVTLALIWGRGALTRTGRRFTTPPSAPEGSSSSVSRRERIATLAQASRLVIASLAAGIALVGFGVISVRLARGVTSWTLTGASTIAAGLLGVAVRDLRRLSKPGVGKPKSKKG